MRNDSNGNHPTHQGETANDFSSPAQQSLHLANCEQTERLGVALGAQLSAGQQIHLLGELGAGKTSLVRGLLQSMGHRGAVKSPTYTLLETYCIDDLTLVHCDLYRISDGAEIDFLGLDQFYLNQSVIIIEWADRGAGRLPSPTLQIHLEYTSDGRTANLLATDPEIITNLISRFTELGKESNAR